VSDTHLQIIIKMRDEASAALKVMSANIAELSGALGQAVASDSTIAAATICHCAIRHANTTKNREPAASAQEAWAAAPPWVWLTLGSLRADGWAAQLRFRRVASAADAAQHADGSLMLYRAAGGAVTRVVEVL